MLTTLTEVTLKNGASMVIRLFEPPQDDYAPRFLHLLRHKDDDSMRGIRQRALGQYAEHCVDRYFVGEVDGRLVGQAWYGLPRCDDGRKWGIGNFGHVYTDSDWRGQGIASEITRVLADHFSAEPTGSCLLCTAGADAGRIYLKYGFEYIPPADRGGPMALIKPTVAPDFARLDADYFAPGLPTTVQAGHIGHRHDIDRMMDFSTPWIQARGQWRFCGPAARVPTFISALHWVEDGRGLVTVLRTSLGSVVGYAFVLSIGAPHETGLRAFDLAVHPHYLADAGMLAGETLRLAAEHEPGDIHAFVSECNRDKLAVVRDAGFCQQYRFARAFSPFSGAGPEERCDILLLRAGA